MAAVLATILAPLLAQRSKKLLIDVVCEGLLANQTNGKRRRRQQNPAEDADESGTVMFVIDVRNPLWGPFSWLGGVDILPSHYERQISFSFGERARILEADIVEERPQEIGAEVVPYHYPPDTLVLKPVLLNQGDSIRIRAVVENPQGSGWLARFGRSGLFAVRATGRIAGIRKIERARSSWAILAYVFLALIVALSPSFVVFLVDVWQALRWQALRTGDTTPVDYLASPVLAGALSALFLVAVVLSWWLGFRIQRSMWIALRYRPPNVLIVPLS